MYWKGMAWGVTAALGIPLCLGLIVGLVVLIALWARRRGAHPRTRWHDREKTGR